MPLIDHVITGHGRPPIVFAHGFGFAHSDWDAQVAHLSPRYQTIAVDLRGHGASPGTPDECSIQQFGADVAEVMETLALPPAILVEHSMGCSVVVEAALQASDRVASVVLVDDSQFAPAMEATLKETFATPDGFPTLTVRWFAEMFTTKSDPAVIAAIGEKVLLDAVRYDTGRLATSIGSLRMPVMAIQTTYSNKRRELPRDSKVVRSTTRRLAGLVGRRADVAQPWGDQTGGAGFYPLLWSRRA